MMPGPDKILACPSCEAHVRQHTLLSGNTFGATFYSDGKRDAPMLPSSPFVSRCHGCSEFFWVETAAVVGSDDDWFSRSTETREPYLRALSIEELAEAVDLKFWSTLDQEILLRREFWWRVNDGSRRVGTVVVPPAELQAKHLANLAGLRSLLDHTDPHQACVMVELSRALGELDAAARYLRRVPLEFGHGIEARFRAAIGNQEKAGGGYSVFKL